MQTNNEETVETINENQAAHVLNVSAVTIRKWRISKFIPEDIYTQKQYMRITRVAYNKEKLLKWAEEHLGFKQEPKDS